MIRIEHLGKAYGEKKVLADLNLCLSGTGHYYLKAPSGSGKTTLFRILAGLEAADSGSVKFPSGFRLTMVFQEDRLFERFTPLENVWMMQKERTPEAVLRKELGKILPADCLDKPAAALSGGMKRRTAAARALLTPSEGVLMDEPFAGLDQESLGRLCRFIREKTENRFLFVSTHTDIPEAELPGKVLTLPFYGIAR